MRLTIACLSLIALAVTASSDAAMLLPGRIVMGTSTTATDGFPRFFATGGFVNGVTSFTNTVSFDDGVGKVEYDLTVEGFDVAGAPAGLFVGTGATGIELGVDNTRIDAGESIKVTYNAVTTSQIGGATMIDPSSWVTTLNEVHFISFDAGDTYTYAGVGAGGATGDDTFELSVGAEVGTGDSFMITGDSGAFRLQWLSHMTTYDFVPEPSSFAAATLGLLAVATRRRNG